MADMGAGDPALFDTTTFRLHTPTGGIVASGVAKALEPGNAADLAGRASRFFAHGNDGPKMLVGAMPFDRDAADHLFQPVRVMRGTARPALAGPAAAAGRNWIVSAEPGAAEYAASVAAALAGIAAGDFRKVVLSRSLKLTAEHAIDPERLLAALSSDPAITPFMTRLPTKSEPRHLVGASPELLLSRRGRQVVSHPLAGSSRRRADPAADRRAAADLTASDKDQREHRAVVEAVLDTLAPYCSALGLFATSTMWHLGTRIVGTLRDPDISSVELAAALHPTPAVCGLPRMAAAHAIRDLETYDRGFYAGAVGWCDAAGDGEWYVSLRCAELHGARATLYAGAGIVAGSDPLAEADETSAKFLAMLNALGIDERGRPASERAA